jgi:hypothetical protein
MWAITRHTPEGEAPEAIRRDWTWVPLPIREPEEDEAKEAANKDETILEIEVADGIRALRHMYRHDAARWWEANTPEAFIFDKSKFELMTPEEAPDRYSFIRTFDEIDP